MGLAIIGGLSVGAHAYVQDCALLLAAGPMLMRSGSRITGLLALAALTPVPYFLLLWGAPWNGVAVGLLASTPIVACILPPGGAGIESPAHSGTYPNSSLTS